MHPEVIVNNWQLIASGVVLTLEIACVAILLGTLLGVLVAVARTSGPRPLAALAAATSKSSATRRCWSSCC